MNPTVFGGSRFGMGGNVCWAELRRSRLDHQAVLRSPATMPRVNKWTLHMLKGLSLSMSCYLSENHGSAFDKTDANQSLLV
jgi:hypothetical protein